MKALNNNRKINWPFFANVSFLVFFALEACLKIFKYQDWTYDLSIFFKAAFLIAITLVASNIFRVKEIILLAGLVCVFILGRINLENGLGINSIVIFLKYLFPLLLLPVYFKIRATTELSLFRVGEHALVLNSVLIIVGYFIDIDCFRTYSGNRFGYNGLLYASATSSYIYIFALIYLATKIWEEDRLSIFDLIIFLATFLIGTKAVYLFLFVFFVIVLYKKIKRYFLVIFTVSTIVFVGLLFFAYQSSEIFKGLYKEYDSLTVLLSKRNVLFLETSYPYIVENWSLQNYLFGGLVNSTFRCQMGFVDLILMFGIIGSLLYLILYIKAISLKWKKLNVKDIALFSCFIVVIATAGNFFMYTFTQFSLLILIDRINQLERKPPVEKDKPLI